MKKRFCKCGYFGMMLISYYHEGHEACREGGSEQLCRKVLVTLSLWGWLKTFVTTLDEDDIIEEREI